MKTWKFTIEETSMNCYLMKATRTLGETIKLPGELSLLPRVLQEAFKVEVEKGILPGEAVYSITSSYLYKLDNIYHESSFGSWSVGNLTGKPSIDYDGRDFYLMVSKEKGMFTWQGNVYDLAKGRSKYFEYVVNFPNIQTTKNFEILKRNR